MRIELKKITQQATANNPGAVQIELEPGYRYLRIIEELVAVTGQLVAAGYAADTLLKVNGTTQRSLLPTELDGINALNNPPSATYGTAAATPYSMYNNANPGPAYLHQFFREFWNPQFDAADKYALDLTADDVATLEVGVASVATAPVVKAYADVIPLSSILADPTRQLNRLGGRPTLVKHSRGSETPGADTLDITKINKQFSRADQVQHIRLVDPSGGQTIDAVEITVNDKLIFKRTKKQNDAELRANNLNPSTGYFDIVPNASDDPRDGWIWTPSDKINLALTFSAAASTAVKWIMQRFGAAD